LMKIGLRRQSAAGWRAVLGRFRVWKAQPTTA